MNRDALEAFARLLVAIEGAEVDEGMFLTGTVEVVSSDGSPVATLSLRGRGSHELVTGPTHDRIIASTEWGSGHAH